jgi:5'-nucleotidase
MQPAQQQPAPHHQAAAIAATAARRRVLVSNDDGISAPGLRALVRVLGAAPQLDVYVCAPSGERSAQSHAITLGR